MWKLELAGPLLIVYKFTMVLDGFLWLYMDLYGFIWILKSGSSRTPNWNIPWIMASFDSDMEHPKWKSQGKSQGSDLQMERGFINLSRKTMEHGALPSGYD